MARDSVKRHASRSPSRSRSRSAAKMRQQAVSTPIQPQTAVYGSQTNRANTILRGHDDPYFTPTDKHPTNLSACDDYLFRIQVISSTTDISTDVFQKAVQGLVKICFPQNVLEEIGIEVVTQHMRSEGASEQNITNMVKVFRSEMIHRITWMLAEYLDSPIKVESSIRAIMAASASIHGAQFGEDVLAHITASIVKLHEQLSNSSTARLAKDTNMGTISPHIFEHAAAIGRGSNTAHQGHSDDGTCSSISSEALLGERPVPPPVDTKAQKAHRQPEDTDVAPVKANETMRQSNKTASSIQSPHGKETKVSTSWRWNVQDVGNMGNIAEHFRRTSDLFAYHALPFARKRLGAQAKRKYLRRDIEAMLATMNFEEFERWVESFRKLEKGDMSMLGRVYSVSSDTPN